MNKKGLYITLAVAVVIAAAAYIAGSVNKNNDEVAADQNLTQVGDNVDFGYLGYVYQKSTVSSLTTDVILPQAASYTSEFYVTFPGLQSEKKFYTSPSNSTSYPVYAESAMIINNDLIEISLFHNELNLSNPTELLFTSDGESVSCAGTECLWSMPDVADGNVMSPDRNYVTTVSYQEPSEKNPDIPVAPTFKSLDIINRDNNILFSYKAGDFSDLGGIFPVEFSPDSSTLLLRASYVQPQEMFTPQMYFLQKLGGEKKKLISFNTSPTLSEGNYDADEVDFVGFLNSHTIFGSDIKEKNVNNVPQDRTYSFVTYDIDSDLLVNTGITYRELLGFDYENAVVYYFDKQGHYFSYNFVSQQAIDLTPNFTFPEYANPNLSPDYNFIKYEVMSERETQNVRGTLDINGAQNKESITEMYVYDVKHHSQKKILTSIHNKSGDAIGDEFYTFVGFIKSNKDLTVNYENWSRYKLITDENDKMLGEYCGESAYNDLRVRAEAGSEYLLTLPGDVPLIWTPNYTDLTTKEFLALADDPNAVCGVGSIVPLKAYPDRLLWYMGNCGGALANEGTAEYYEQQACMKTVDSVDTYFQVSS
ncbi:MAG: hypothetical protein WC495_00315 [Patescibacteria group bacterium]|jgi:hypothetical protein